MTYRTLLKKIEEMGGDAMDWPVTIEVDGNYFEARYVYKIASERDDVVGIAEPDCPVIVIN